MRNAKLGLLIVGVFMMSLLSVSCSKKEVKQVSQESKMSLEAFTLAETVKNAFIRNDRGVLQNNSTEEGFKDITANTQVYDSVDITMTPRWVEIEAEHLLVNIAWKSTWIVSGRRTEERGMAVFKMQGKPLKIAKILRGNPFLYPAK